MIGIACIVEGHGEVAALPELIRRIFLELIPGCYPKVVAPIRIHRDKLTKEGEVERAVQLAAAKVTPNGAVLILIDADKECPVELAAALKERATRARSDLPITVVIAQCEYEAWFIAAARSLSLLPDHEQPPANPEGIRGAKEWVSKRLPLGKYSETADQPSLTATMSLDEARRAPSFDKLVRELIALAQRAAT
ncbi:MAG: DUF4276 family protein [Bryobacterales bacterium]|nr:DUF4276 family protein [Bryobacterales bacterium]